MKIKYKRPAKKINAMTMRQEKYVQNYVTNGFDSIKAAKDAGYKAKDLVVVASRLQGTPAVQKMINKYQELVEKVTTVTLEKKLKKLGQIIDAYVPEDREPDPRKASVAISAIAEANKMQGHYAPEKHLSVNANLNADADIIKLSQLTEEIIKSKEKPF